MTLSRGDRIFAWILSGVAVAMTLFFLVSVWTHTTPTDKFSIVFAGIMAAKFSWMMVEDQAKTRNTICPTCGRRR